MHLECLLGGDTDRKIAMPHTPLAESQLTLLAHTRSKHMYLFLLNHGCYFFQVNIATHLFQLIVTFLLLSSSYRREIRKGNKKDQDREMIEK